MALPEHGPVFSFATQSADGTLGDPGVLTYEPYFGLREKPFSLSTDPRFFFGGSSQRPVFDSLVAGIRRREGILALTGEPGTGKTILCRSVLQALDRKTFAAFVPDPFVSREDLLKTLLVDFGVTSIDEIRSGRLQGATRTDLSYQLHQFLASLQALHAFAVVVIDEAQNLTPQLLEEVRVLADMEDRQKLLQVLLVGQPELEALFAPFEMRQLRQRLSLQCELLPLAHNDVRLYVEHRLLVAGNRHTIQFSDSAFDRVWRVSNGIPRLVNLVCDRALARAAQDHTNQVTSDHVAAAITLLRLQETRSPDETKKHALPLPKAPTLPTARPDPMGPRDMNLKSLDDIWAAQSQDSTVSEASSFPVFDESDNQFSLLPLLVSWRRTLMVSWRRALTVLAVGLVVVLTIGIWSYIYSTPPPADDVRVPALPAREAIRPPPEPTSVPVPLSVPAIQPSEARGYQQPGGSTAPTAEPASAREGGTFAIRMATLETPGGAGRAVRELQALGYGAYSREAILGTGQPAYAVFLGPYADMAAAQRDLQRAQEIRGYTAGRIVSAR